MLGPSVDNRVDGRGVRGEGTLLSPSMTGLQGACAFPSEDSSEVAETVDSTERCDTRVIFLFAGSGVCALSSSVLSARLLPCEMVC